jgi:putative intracellular protease/amidase
MSASIDVLNPANPKRVLIVASNPSTSPTTGWPIGFWWAELTHPYWEFVEHGYEVTIASPNGGALVGDSFSDPEDASGYSAHDLISMGFKASPTHSALLENTVSLNAVNVEDFDAVFFVGGQGPMVTFVDTPSVHQIVTKFYDAGKPTAVVCHATCILLTAKKGDGSLIVDGKTWTGFADSEEAFADSFVGTKIQPFWIEERAKQMPGTNFVVHSMFKSFVVRDGHLITGQQQYSGAAAARLVIEALGV